MLAADQTAFQLNAYYCYSGYFSERVLEVVMTKAKIALSFSEIALSYRSNPCLGRRKGERIVGINNQTRPAHYEFIASLAV